MTSDGASAAAAAALGTCRERSAGWAAGRASRVSATRGGAGVSRRKRPTKPRRFGGFEGALADWVGAAAEVEGGRVAGPVADRAAVADPGVAGVEGPAVWAGPVVEVAGGEVADEEGPAWDGPGVDVAGVEVPATWDGPGVEGPAAPDDPGVDIAGVEGPAAGGAVVGAVGPVGGGDPVAAGGATGLGSALARRNSPRRPLGFRPAAPLGAVAGAGASLGADASRTGVAGLRDTDARWDAAGFAPLAADEDGPAEAAE